MSAHSQIVANKVLFSAVEEYIALGQSVLFRVKGTSMRPYLRSERDLVEFAPCDIDQLKKGDIVLFRYHGTYLMHRIRKRKGEKLCIQGDGVLANKEYPLTSDVIAIVRSVIRVADSGRRTAIPCASLRWRILSALWLILPRLAKRAILHFC